MWNMFNINKLYFCKKYMRRCKKEAKTFLKYRKYPIKRLQVLWLSTLIFLWFWIPVSWFLLVLCYTAMREKCPDMELFLVRIFLYSDWIRKLVNLRIQSEYRKIRTRNNSVLGHFSTVLVYGVNLRIHSEYKKIQTRNNSVFGHFSRRAQSWS